MSWVAHRAFSVRFTFNEHPSRLTVGRRIFPPSQNKWVKWRESAHKFFLLFERQQYITINKTEELSSRRQYSVYFYFVSFSFSISTWSTHSFSLSFLQPFSIQLQKLIFKRKHSKSTSTSLLCDFIFARTSTKQRESSQYLKKRIIKARRRWRDICENVKTQKNANKRLKFN